MIFMLCISANDTFKIVLQIIYIFVGIVMKTSSAINTFIIFNFTPSLFFPQTRQYRTIHNDMSSQMP